MVNELVINNVKTVNPRLHLGHAIPIVFFLAVRYSFYDISIIFCIAYFSTLLKKLCKWRFSMTFSC